ncbi:MAG: CHASE3 domain-containing protein [Caulobacteraceae bacterium]|nr:CHASE3 domain-containing protein [Caulobacteraceae bacterium]
MAEVALTPSRGAARERTLRLLGVTLGALFLAFAGLGGVFFWYDSASEWVNHTREVRSAIAEVMEGLAEAESAQRGLLLTEDRRFIEHLSQARRHIDDDIQAIERLTRDNPEQQGRLERLRALTQIRLQVIDRTVAMAQAGQAREATDLILQGQGLSAMIDIRALLQEFAAEEARLDARRSARVGEIRIILIVALVVFALTLAGLLVHGLREIALDRETEARQTAELRKLLGERTLLLAEVNHRVKNSLQQVASVIRLQTRTVVHEGARQALNDALSRIMAVGRVHEQLYRGADVGEFDAGEYAAVLARELVDSMGREDVALELVVTPAKLDLTRAVPLALILNELVTNALKYGCLPDTRGCIRVGFGAVDEGYRLSVADKGPGVPGDFAPESSKSLGMRVIQALARQLNGRLVVEKPPVGAEFAVVFPKGVS